MLGRSLKKATPTGSRTKAPATFVATPARLTFQPARYGQQKAKFQPNDGERQRQAGPIQLGNRLAQIGAQGKNEQQDCR